MKYLLTNGNKTKDINLYIKDILYLNFKLLPNQIPFNIDIGVNKVQLEESKVEFEDKTSDLIKDLLKRLSDRHNVTLILSSMEVSTTEIKVQIDINNDDTGIYSIDILK
jgi:hypothetical protein